MKLIDAQIHVWRPDTPEHPWVRGGPAPHSPSYSIGEALALLDAEGVDAAVIVPPSWSGTDNSYALEAAAAHPDRFAVMGRFDYASPDVAARLARWRDQPGMLGIRATVSDPVTLGMFRDPENRWFWRRCAEIGLPLMCYAPGLLDLVHGLAEDAPELRIVLDHAGRNARGPRDDAAWGDFDRLLGFAARPNVAVKVSSLPCFSTEPYPFANLHPWIRGIYEAFGADRMIWGSDVSRLTCSYGENVRLFAEALDFLSEEDRRKIFAGSVARWCDARFPEARG
jgi:L-fuconolactonase